MERLLQICASYSLAQQCFFMFWLLFRLVHCLWIPLPFAPLDAYIYHDELENPVLAKGVCLTYTYTPVGCITGKSELIHVHTHSARMPSFLDKEACRLEAHRIRSRVARFDMTFVVLISFLNPQHKDFRSFFNNSY